MQPANSPETDEKPITRPLAKHSRVGTTWVSLAAFVLLLLLLAIFIIQNSANVDIKYFGAKGHLSFGVAMLLAVIAGSLLTLLIGSARIVQLRVATKRMSRQNSEK